MPNHVINEVIFTGVDLLTQEALRERLCDEKGDVDFERLLPAPLNAWRGGVGTVHEKKLPPDAMKWSTENWGTKWNAYHHQPVESTDNSIVFRFKTAWKAPYGWLVAILNTFKLSFTHNWLSEGGWAGQSGEWKYGEPASPFSNYEWKETEILEGSELHKHLHKLLWGVEEFPEDEETVE